MSASLALTNVGGLASADAALVAAARAGEQRAFAVLVGRYRYLVLSVAHAYDGDASEREEIAQQAFLTAWHRLPSLRRPDLFRSWLCGIAQRVGKRWQRDERSRRAHGSAPQLLERHPSAEPSALDRAIDRENELMIGAALSAIPERYRLALVLYYAEDQSVEAVAAALGITPQNVRSRLWRGRKMLHGRVAALLAATLPALRRPRPGFVAAVVAAIAGLDLPSVGAGDLARRQPAWPAAIVVQMILVSMAVPLAMLSVGRLARRTAVPATVAGLGGATPGQAVGFLAGLPRLSLAGAAEERGPSPAAGNILAFDFEDGILAPNYIDGFLVPGPPRAGNRYCMIGTSAFQSDMGGKTAAVVRAPIGSDTLFHASSAQALSFDYWVSAGKWLVVLAYDNDIQENAYQATKRFVRQRWTHARVRLGDLRTNDHKRGLRDGDAVRLIGVLGGGDHGIHPLYIDNLKIEDSGGPELVPATSFALPLDE